MECRCIRRILAHPPVGVTLAVTLSIFSGLAGCDEKPPILPQTPPKPATTQAAIGVVRPTTQELVEGKRKKQALSAAPVSIQVPVSWLLETRTGTSLEGECPHGTVSIHIAMQGVPLKADAVAAMDRRSHTQATTQSTDLLVVPMRSIGGDARAMEQREFVRHIPRERENGQVDYVDRVEWMVSVFVPNSSGFNVLTLNFVGLSVDQYRLDREFLEKILASLQYDASSSTQGR